MKLLISKSSIRSKGWDYGLGKHMIYFSNEIAPIQCYITMMYKNCILHKNNNKQNKVHNTD